MLKINTKVTKWDLSPLLSNDQDPALEKKKKMVETQVKKFANQWKDRKDYLKNPRILKQALDDYEKLSAEYGTDGDVGYYFWLRTKQDQINPKLKAQYHQIRDLSIKLSNEIEFFTNRLSKISKEEQKKFLKEPSLKKYKHFLEGLFEVAKYILSEEEEKILTIKSTTSYANWVRMVSDFISREEREVLTEKNKREITTFYEMLSNLSSKKKKVRESNAQAVNEILKKHSDVAEAEINSILTDEQVTHRLKNIKRPDLPRHIADDIDSKVVDTLVKSVSARFDISKRYYKIKAALLGVDKLEYYDRVAEYGSVDKKYKYPEAVKLVGDTFNSLDPEFLEIYQDYVENGRFDVFPKKGKSGGAFCVHGLITQPGYVMLNFTGRLWDVTSIAHEMGHAINNELIKKKQNALNFGTPLSTAEVASTFMEDFVLEKLLSGANDEIKLAIMMAKMDDLVASVPRQIACYKFETELHRDFREKGYLSKKEIGKLFQKHMKAYMGTYVRQSPGSENWWVYWSHIRRFFYVYSYASGLLISKALQKMVREDPAQIGKVKEFLSVGLSEAPKKTFKRLGIDISDEKFWKQGLKEIDDFLTETEKLAMRLGKVKYPMRKKSS